MSKSLLSWKRLMLLGCTALTSVAMGSAAYADEDLETVIITGTRFDAEVAPAKANPDTMEPQTIIDRSYIADSLSPASSYVGILAIVPSMTGTDVNGPGLSDGAVKNTMRGLPDGMYNQTYDGIPFGDTNGPSHHSLSYFPASAIGTIDVDRGPGNAGNMGAATYGGSVNMFSEALTSDTQGRLLASYGSFNTKVFNANFQSGTFDAAVPTRVLVNLQDTSTNGALTLQSLTQVNALGKIESDLSENWKLTLFSSYTHLNEHLNDNAGATPAQIARYGKNFALQDTNPNLPTYVKYNEPVKWTDMDYARLKGAVTETLHIDNTFYSYAYTNDTFSARNIEQTQADILANTAEGMGGKSVPVINGVKQPATDIPGYTKLNAYRNYGDIFRVSQDYNIGDVSGQIRTGIWWETSSTTRARFDYDITKCVALGINPFNTDATACRDSSLSPKSSVHLTGKPDVNNNGYAEYLEHTGWNQYQPFLEVDIKPTDALTITPGIKYVNWDHTSDAVVEPKLLKPAQYSFTTTDTLYYLEANYKIMPNWSIYAQYADGIYVPDISAFEQKTPVFQFPKAETTTNYQIGTVFYADNFTFDADLYYIPVKNNIVEQSCSLTGGPSGDTCAVNTGKATYEGVEGEGTYAFDQDALRGLVAFLNGSVMSSKSEGVWVKSAPAWTAAGGLIYKHDGWKFSLLDKFVGPQFSDNVENAHYKIGTYSQITATAGYDFGTMEFDVEADNLADSRHVAAITENDATWQPNRLNSKDQYFFQAPRSIMATLKAHF